MSSLRRAVFLDRDGVLVEDVECLAEHERIRVYDGIPAALQTLKSAGYALVVVSNQTVVSRGICTEEQVVSINAEIGARILRAGGPNLDANYFCPHHPKATLERYRVVCECRKPSPGMMLRAAREWGLDLAGSFMIGDRITDIVAGRRAGCKTIWVQTGQHLAPQIYTTEPVDSNITADHICPGLPEAARWIVENHP